MHPYLRPTAPIASDAVLPGDPKRAMELATRATERPLMSNLSRGLWGYHGTTPQGRELTVQSTGIGGASAAIVLAELAEHGVRRAIRVGTCAALDAELQPGDVLVASGALPGDGVSGKIGTLDVEHPDPGLTSALVHATEPVSAAVVATTDLYYDPDSTRRAAWGAAGAVALEMSAAPLFAVGRQDRVAVACALVVATATDGRHLGPDELDEAALTVGERAVAALGAQAPASVP